ncbi:hypothetical protein [Lacimicrobium alkaliphilum]|uniref:Uncharacterized protein n=1 Tax=Lacimicrobium alkaliphilum TaxID=1526571 RepID=A0A0U3A9V9_9ALTE|nr:hypothetical protein [Lacimicrobium alkaliphilum]ALS97790.1 hypothetical protein AT746_05545 [Lacimicrobium alkaliphilum]
MISEAITTSILASTIYDMLKHSLALSRANLKDRLKNWLVDDSTLRALENQISRMELNSDMSESAIERSLLASNDTLEIIRQIKPNKSTTIIQTHSGKGDNVAGNKIINHQ